MTHERIFTRHQHLGDDANNIIEQLMNSIPGSTLEFPEFMNPMVGEYVMPIIDHGIVAHISAMLSDDLPEEVRDNNIKLMVAGMGETVTAHLYNLSKVI